MNAFLMTRRPLDATDGWVGMQMGEREGEESKTLGGKTAQEAVADENEGRAASREIAERRRGQAVYERGSRWACVADAAEGRVGKVVGEMEGENLAVGVGAEGRHSHHAWTVGVLQMAD